MRHDVKSKIAIIGAGAAGLSAAHFLKEKGYTAITVLEKNNYPGGKCLSVKFGDKAYDQGAMIMTITHATIRKLIRHYDIKPLRPCAYLQLDKALPKPHNRFAFNRLKQIARYLYLRWKAMSLVRKGAVLPAELCGTADLWFEYNKLDELKIELQLLYAMFGFGYFDEIPAVYPLIYFDAYKLVLTTLVLHSRFCAKQLKTVLSVIDNGYQTLWSVISQRVNVKYNTHIKKITKENGKVVIEDEQGQQLFDFLIIACPSDQVSEMVHLPDSSLGVDVAFRRYPFYSYLCRIKDFEPESILFSDHILNKRKDWPVNISLLDRKLCVYAIYGYASANNSVEIFKANCQAALNDYQASIVEDIAIKQWQMTPHLTTKEIKYFYKAMHDLQGLDNIFYTGETMMFSDVNYAADYSRKLVDKFF